MARISFRYAAPMGDRRHFVDEEDVAVLIGRLPEDLLGRLRVVRFDDESRGGHVAGYTTTRGRREISLWRIGN